MKIACIVGLTWEVPPAQYGGTERVMATLVRGLEARGHHVTLYAAGDSTGTATVRTTRPLHLGADVSNDERLLANLALAYKLQAEQGEYDVVISFCDEAILPITNDFTTPVLHSLHMPFLPHNIPTFTSYKELSYIALSEAQKQPLPELNYVATIHNGLNVAAVPFNARRGENLVYLGTIHPWKGIHLLRPLAQRLGLTIQLAGQIADHAYYAREIEPYLGSAFCYHGELNDAQKYDFFANAAALLYPVLVRDTCPITIMEAAAAGLPVIGFGNGAIPELVRNGVTGYVVDDIAAMELVVSTKAYKAIDPARCRDYASRYFSADRMVEAYLAAAVLSLETDRFLQPDAVDAIDCA